MCRNPCSYLAGYVLTESKKWKLSGCLVQLFATPWTVAYQAPPFLGFPGKNTEVGCHFLLQGLFPTQGSNSGLPHHEQTLDHLSHRIKQCSKEVRSRLTGKKSFSGIYSRAGHCKLHGNSELGKLDQGAWKKSSYRTQPP